MSESAELDQVVRCLCCFSEVKEGDGIELRGTPGVGSRFDSTLLSEESLAVIVCDKCLEESYDRVRIVYVERPSPRRTVRAWSPNYDASEPLREVDSVAEQASDGTLPTTLEDIRVPLEKQIRQTVEHLVSRRAGSRCRVAGDGQHDPGLVPGHGVACTKCGDELAADHPMPHSSVPPSKLTVLEKFARDNPRAPMAQLLSIFFDGAMG